MRDLAKRIDMLHKPEGIVALLDDLRSQLSAVQRERSVIRQLLLVMRELTIPRMFY